MKLLLKLWYFKLWSPSISWSGINNIDSDQEGTVLTCTATRLTYFLQGESDRGNGLERRGRKICTRIDFYYFFFFSKNKRRISRLEKGLHSMEKCYFSSMIVEPWPRSELSRFFPHSQPTLVYTLFTRCLEEWHNSVRCDVATAVELIIHGLIEPDKRYWILDSRFSSWTLE